MKQLKTTIDYLKSIQNPNSDILALLNLYDIQSLQLDDIDNKIASCKSVLDISNHMTDKETIEKEIFKEITQFDFKCMNSLDKVVVYNEENYRNKTRTLQIGLDFKAFNNTYHSSFKKEEFIRNYTITSDIVYEKSAFFPCYYSDVRTHLITDTIEELSNENVVAFKFDYNVILFSRKKFCIISKSKIKRISLKDKTYFTCATYDGKYGLFDDNLNICIPFVYNNISIKNDYAIVSKQKYIDGKYVELFGYYSISNNKEILPCIFAQASHFNVKYKRAKIKMPNLESEFNIDLNGNIL